MFSLKEMHSKYEMDSKLLKWIAENNSEKVTHFYGLDLLPAGANYSQMDWKLEQEISEHAVTVMLYVLTFKLGRDRIFHASLAQMREDLLRFYGLDYSRTKIHRALKELEQKGAIASVAKTQKGSFYIFKLEE